VKYFREEFVAHITNRGCPFDPVRSTVFSAITGATGGTA